LEMTQIKMNTGDQSMAKFEKPMDKLVKILADNEPKGPQNSCKLFD